MTSSAAYRAASTSPHPCCECLELMVVPCVPLGRAAATMVGGSFAAVFLYVAAGYVGGLVCFGHYTQGDYTFFHFLSGYAVLVVGWGLYLVGPMLALLVLAAWYQHAIACSLNDTGGPPCNRASANPDWATAAVACFCVVYLAMVVLQHRLRKRYSKQTIAVCTAECWFTCCAPLCGVAVALHKARDAQDEDGTEIPAYTA